VAGQIVARFRFSRIHAVQGFMRKETMAARQQFGIAASDPALSSRFGEEKPGVRAATPAAKLSAGLGVFGSVPG
jgi:hypothetical protein